MSINKIFRSSTKELSSTHVIAVCGMLLALRVVLGYFSNITLVFLPTVKFGFNFLPIAICAIMFGPVAAGAIGGLGDIISYMLNSAGGAYFPGWTISGIAAGIIYGLIFYKNNATISRIVVCKILIAIFIELLLGSLWLQIQFDKPFLDMLVIRGIKLLITTPLDAIILITVSQAMKKVKLPIMQNKKLLE